MSTINDSDLLLVERNGNLHQITYDQMSTLNDDDILLVERGGVQYKVEAQYVSTGANGLIIPPVEVLTPINGAGITEFDQYEPLSSTITAVGEAGGIPKDTDEILSVVDNITGAVAFDGNDHLIIPNFTGAPQGTNDWTIEFYAYWEDFTTGQDGQGFQYLTWSASTSHPNYRIALTMHDGRYVLTDSPNYGGVWHSSYNDIGSYTGVVAPLKTWHHVAIQRSSGVDTIYIDGQIQFTASGHTSSSYGSTGNWYLGGSGSHYSNVSISNFRVLSGTALYSSTFTPPSTPLTNIDNTVLLCCQSSSSVTDAAVSPGTITTSGNPTATEVNVSGNKILSFPTNTNFSGLSVGDEVQTGVTITAIDAAATSQQEVNATLNKTHPTDYSGPDSSISADSLTISCTAERYAEAISSIPASNYNNYSEFTVDSVSSSKMLGVAVGSSDTKINNGVGSYVTYREGGYVVKYPGNQTLTSSVASYTQGDVIGVAIDSTNVTFYKNGDLQGTYAHGLSGDYYATALVRNNGIAGQNTTMTANFGATAFAHTPPTGYTELTETVTTYPSVTVDGGTWDTSNQSQVWSSQATGGSLGSVDIAFNGEVPAVGTSPSPGNYASPMTFEPTAFSTPGSVTSLVIYGTRNANSPRYIKVDGVIVPCTDNNTFQELTVDVTSFSSIVCEHNGSDGSSIGAIIVNGNILVDAVEDSQVWSNGTHGNSFFAGVSLVPSRAFDGNENNHAVPANSAQFVYTGWNIAYSTSLEVLATYSNASISNPITFQTSNGDVAPTLNSDNVKRWYSVSGSGTVTGLTLSHNTANLFAVKVDGKLLIDAGVRDLGDRYVSSSTPYEKSLTFTDDTQLANMVTPLEMVDANGNVVTPVSDTIANVSNNVLTLQGNTNLAYFQPVSYTHLTLPTKA